MRCQHDCRQVSQNRILQEFEAIDAHDVQNHGVVFVLRDQLETRFKIICLVHTAHVKNFGHGCENIGFIVDHQDLFFFQRARCIHCTVSFSLKIKGSPYSKDMPAAQRKTARSISWKASPEKPRDLICLYLRSLGQIWQSLLSIHDRGKGSPSPVGYHSLDQPENARPRRFCEISSSVAKRAVSKGPGICGASGTIICAPMANFNHCLRRTDLAMRPELPYLE